jgi:hypothetical protein
MKRREAQQDDYKYMHGTVNRAVTGLYTNKYRAIQVNLKTNEAAREAFTEGMSAMAYLANALAKEGIMKGGSFDDQMKMVSTTCHEAAKVLGFTTQPKWSSPGLISRATKGSWGRHAMKPSVPGLKRRPFPCQCPQKAGRSSFLPEPNARIQCCSVPNVICCDAPAQRMRWQNRVFTRCRGRV